MRGKTTLPLCFLCVASVTGVQSRVTTSFISVYSDFFFFFTYEQRNNEKNPENNDNFNILGNKSQFPGNTNYSLKLPWKLFGNVPENLTGYHSLPFATIVLSYSAVNDLLQYFHHVLTSKARIHVMDSAQ